MQSFARLFRRTVVPKSCQCTETDGKHFLASCLPYNYHKRLFQGSNDIDSTQLQIKLSKTPKPKTPYKDLQFGIDFTDHMLEINWTKDHGWENPQIKPFDFFKVHPAANGFHYALQAFEGMKAFRDNNDQIRLFRPQMNWNRLNQSCQALVFPSVHSQEFQKCVETFLTVEKSWIPNVDGYALYLRPTIVSTHVRNKYIFYIPPFFLPFLFFVT